jgi:hypothetical protein
MPTHHIKIHEPRERSMPDIFKLTPQDMVCKHRQIGMLALDCLNACHLIHTECPFSGFGPLSGLCIDLAPLNDFLFSSFVDLLR